MSLGSVPAADPSPLSPFDELDAIRRSLAGKDPSLVALDFDGTLAEIVDDPTAPGLTPGRRALLGRIPRPGRWLAVVSGRALEDLRTRIGLAGTIYIGNHGLEIEGPGILQRPPAEVAERLVGLLQRLDSVLTRHPIGARFEAENKTWTATLHVRPREDAASHANLREAIEDDVAAEGFEVRRGKSSWEIRPAGAPDKGQALRRLIDALPGVTAQGTLYIGDDVTDEDAFRALPEAFTIRVGESGVETAARYRLPDPAAVYEFLAALFTA